MPTSSEESLRQALIEVEHLRQCEAMHRKNAESLLEGLQRLSIAESQQDSLDSILAILLEVLEIDAVGILKLRQDGTIFPLASSGATLSLPSGAPEGPVARALGGKTVILNDSLAAGCRLRCGLPGSAMLHPIVSGEIAAVVICFRRQRAAFGAMDRDKLRFFLPLVEHAIRHLAKLTELQRVVRELETARAAAEESARRDELSGLANRKAMDEALSATLSAADARSFCCAIIDLDDFKPINDTFGHDLGDLVLREVGARLRKVVDGVGIAARLGGDEFAALMPNVDDARTADALGRSLVAIFAEPMRLQGRELSVRASIGVARSDEAGRSVQEIISAADKAMYSIKHTKETAYAIYDPRRLEKGITRYERQRLLEAIRTWEIRPYFQPKVDLATGRIVGVEALARWVEPKGLIVMPASFLPAIEDHGLQAEFIGSMARQVVGELKTWADLTSPDFDVAINVSEATLATQNGLDELLWILDDDVGHLRITCEITEDVFIARSSDRIRNSIQALRATGVRVSLDDFGTGYGSFRHLQELQIDELKIDTKIVSGIGCEHSAEIIIEGFVAIARGLGIDIVAEGIETEKQAQFLLKLGCRTGQGFLFGRPMPSHEMKERLAAARPPGQMARL